MNKFTVIAVLIILSTLFIVYFNASKIINSNQTNKSTKTPASNTSLSNSTSINSEVYNCSKDSDCIIVNTGCCFNGLKNQETCINNNYNIKWKNNLNCSKTICPMFFVESKANCTCDNGQCTLNYYSAFTHS